MSSLLPHHDKGFFPKDMRRWTFVSKTNTWIGIAPLITCINNKRCLEWSPARWLMKTWCDQKEMTVNRTSTNWELQRQKSCGCQIYTAMTLKFFFLFFVYCRISWFDDDTSFADITHTSRRPGVFYFYFRLFFLWAQQYSRLTTFNTDDGIDWLSRSDESLLKLNFGGSVRDWEKAEFVDRSAEGDF